MKIKILLLAVLVCGVGVLSYIYFRPVVGSVVNVSSKSAGLAWYTKNKVSGCVWVWRNGKIINNLCEKNKENNHLMTIDKLEADSQYSYLLLNKMAFNWGKFRTFKELDLPNFPEPVYRQYLSKGNDDPYSLIISRIVDGNKSPVSSTLATKANEKGQWVIERSLYRDLKTGQPFSPVSGYVEAITFISPNGKTGVDYTALYD